MAGTERRVNTEKITSVLRFLDIRQLDSSQEAELIQSVVESDGKAIILVHPFVPVSEETISTLESRHNSRIRKLISSVACPVIIFEDYETIEMTKIKLCLLGIDRTIYVVLTDISTPTPHIDGRTIDERWGLITERLSSLGITKVDIGGKYYHGERYGIPEGQGCVATLNERLTSVGFETALQMEVCYPEGRNLV